MKTISLEQAVALLENASAVIVGGNYVTYPSLLDLEEPDSPFLILSPGEMDDEQSFNPEDNETATVDEANGNLVLTDTMGEEVTITLLHSGPVKVK